MAGTGDTSHTHRNSSTLHLTYLCINMPVLHARILIPTPHIKHHLLAMSDEPSHHSRNDGPQSTSLVTKRKSSRRSRPSDPTHEVHTAQGNSPKATRKATRSSRKNKHSSKKPPTQEDASETTCESSQSSQPSKRMKKDPPPQELPTQDNQPATDTFIQQPRPWNPNPYVKKDSFIHGLQEERNADVLAYRCHCSASLIRLNYPSICFLSLIRQVFCKATLWLCPSLRRCHCLASLIHPN